MVRTRQEGKQSRWLTRSNSGFLTASKEIEPRRDGQLRRCKHRGTFDASPTGLGERRPESWPVSRIASKTDVDYSSGRIRGTTLDQAKGRQKEGKTLQSHRVW